MKRAKSWGIILIVFVLLLTACSNEEIPEAHFYSWMYDINLDKYDARDILGDPNSNSDTTWSNYELIDGIAGTFEIHQTYSYSSYGYKLHYWTWETYVDDTTYTAVINALNKAFPSNDDRTSYISEEQAEDLDEVRAYKAEQFKTGNYYEKWTTSSEKSLSELNEEEISEYYHVILFLKKDDKICIQYVPTNTYSILGSYSFYDMD